MSRLLYLGQGTADFLVENIEQHIDRYLESGFEDLEAKGDWRIPLSISAGLSALEALIPDKGPDAEVHNSLLVGRALSALTPSLARENRLWIRLSHIEGLQYSRARWLRDVPEDKVAKAVGIHFFAPTWTRCRDDHSISKLWWNYWISSVILPSAPEQALRLLLSSADIRSNIVERARIGTRLPLAKSIFRLLERDESVRTSETKFRRFMKELNRKAAGRHLEVWTDGQLDEFIETCVAAAHTS